MDVFSYLLDRDFFRLPKGNGQVVYIDLESLSLDKEDVCYNSDDGTVQLTYSYDDVISPFKEYVILFKKLAELGYKVILDEKLIDDETFIFTPCEPAESLWENDDYLTDLDRKIMATLEKKEIAKPITISYFDYFSSEQSLKPPFVIKDAMSFGLGRRALVSNSEQLNILQEFWALDSDDKKFFSDVVIQEYVETPTKYNTSLRVLVSSCGEVMCAALKCAEPQELGRDSYLSDNDWFNRIFFNESSPYFLGGETIGSNTFDGLKGILLGISNYSKAERQILIAHGIDPQNCEVPEEIRLACQEVMKDWGKELGAICAMDFIYDVKNKKWKYLNNTRFPGLEPYASKYGIPFYRTGYNCPITERRKRDIIARIHSLKLAMEKKQRKVYKRAEE